MNILYFAWVRERIGVQTEIYDGSGKTVRDVLADLRQKSEAHELALKDDAVLRYALNQELVPIDAEIGDARELAIFPPMTGG